MRRIVLAFVLFLSSIPAFAVDYYWWDQVSQFSYTTPLAVCNNFKNNSTQYNNYNVTGTKVISVTRHDCEFTDKTSGAKRYDVVSAFRYGDGCAAPKTYNTATGVCEAAVTCPYGQMATNGVCGPICPTGQHYGRTALTPLEISQCIQDCPANTFDTTAPGKLSVCSPTKPVDTAAPIKKTCDAGFRQVGFKADGSAECVVKEVPPDPCPKGTHNISADIATPNCTSDVPMTEKTTTAAPTTNADGSKTTVKTETVNNANGTTETKTTTTVTKADGSETKTVTYSGTGNGAATQDGAGTGTGENTAGGGGGGGGRGSGSGAGDGDGVTGAPETFFDKKDKTFSASITTFKNAVNNAPIVTAGGNFLKGTVSGGGCFNGTVSLPFLKTTVDFAQYLCGPNVSEVLKVMAIGLMIGAAFAAFRMGFL